MATSLRERPLKTTRDDVSNSLLLKNPTYYRKHCINGKHGDLVSVNREHSWNVTKMFTSAFKIGNKLQSSTNIIYMSTGTVLAMESILSVLLLLNITCELVLLSISECHRARAGFVKHFFKYLS